MTSPVRADRRPRVQRGLVAVALIASTLGLGVASGALLSPHSPPKIAALSVTPSAVSQFGGPVTLSATVTAAATCVLSVTPAISGLPLRSSCKNSNYARSVTLSPNLSSRAIRYTFALDAVGSGSLTRTVSLTQSALGATLSATWSAPQPLEGLHGLPIALACPSTVCVAADANGYVVTAGSAPQLVDPNGLTGLTCPVANFCLAVDQVGNVVTFDGSLWSQPSLVDAAGFTDVSCASSTFCVALDADGDATTFDGSSWSTPTAIDALAVPDVIACPSSSTCIAGDGAGDTVVDTDGAWGAATNVDPSGVTALACPTQTDCIGVDSTGHEVEWSDGTWLPPVSINSGAAVVALACANSGSTIATANCFGLDTTGDFIRDLGGVWQAPYLIDSLSEPTAISCATTTSCDFVDADGSLHVLNAGAWSKSLVDRDTGYLGAVSCASATVCMAVGTQGEDVIGGDTQWSTVASSPLAVATAVSCAGDVCAVGGDGGKIVVRTANKWSAVQSVGANPITGISCVSSSFCMAVDSSGSYSIFSGTTWSAMKAIDVKYGRGFAGVSCVNATLCVLIDLSGHELVWRSAGALFSKVVDTVGGALTSISCTTSGVCVAGDATGYAITMTYTARHAKFTWTAPTHVSSSAITAVSCASTFFCGATTEAGGYLQWVRGTWSSVTPVDANPLVTLGCSAQGNCVAIDDQDQQVTATFR